MKDLTFQDLLDGLKQVKKEHIKQIKVSDRISIKKQIDRINQLITIANHNQ